MGMKVVFFFYPERRDCMTKVLRYLEQIGVPAKSSRSFGLRAFIEVSQSIDLRDLVERVECVSRVGMVLAEVPREVELSKLAEAVASAVESYLRDQGLCVAVRCRRWDKSYPRSSVEVAKYIAERLALRGLRVSPRCGDELLVAIDRDRVLVAIVREQWMRVRNYMPKSIARRVTCVACMIQGAYEIADLIQLARALGVELVLLKPSPSALEKALSMLGASSLPPEVRVSNDFSEVLRSVDTAVLLTRYGVGNEKTLAELAKRFRRIALVVGNEFSDPPPYVRDQCEYSVRLGPETGKPMRSCVALAYALGVVLTSMWGQGDEQSLR